MLKYVIMCGAIAPIRLCQHLLMKGVKVLAIGSVVWLYAITFGISAIIAIVLLIIAARRTRD